MMREKLTRVLVVMAVCVLLPAFGAQAQTAPSTIKVGSALALTGPMADQGVQLKHGYEIVVEKINAAGGVFVKEYNKKIPIELRILDDESSGQKTQTQLESINSWGAVAALGGLGCSSFEMGTPICQKNKITWLGAGCGGWAPHQLGNDWLYSLFAKTPYLSPMVFEMIMEQPEPRPKKVAVFEINQLDAQEAMGYWTETAKKLGFQIVFHQKYPPGTKDFSAMITGAKAAGAEILLAYPTPPEGPAIVKQMKELDFAPKVTHFVRAAEGAGFGPSLGPLADYVTLPVAWSDKYQFPENDYLIAKFKEKTGKGPDLTAGNGYASGQVLAAAIEKAGSLDRTAIRNAVKGIDMMTVSGPIKFSNIGHPEDKVLVIAQWHGGDRKIVNTNAPGKKFPKEVPVTPLKWMPKWSER